jgi:hypothetical protein
MDLTKKSAWTIGFLAALSAGCQTAAPEQLQPTAKPEAPQSQLEAPRAPAVPNTPATPAFPAIASRTDAALGELLELESAFAAQDCPRVLEKWRGLALPETERRLLEAPTSLAVPVALCNARLNPESRERAEIASHILERAEQRHSPLLDRARLARFSADFHMAHGNLDEAAAAAKREQDQLILASEMLAAITGTTPIAEPSAAQSAAGAIQTLPSVGNPTDANTIDKAIADARTALNAGDPKSAVGILDGIPEKDRNERIRRLRKESAENHVRDMRTKAREFYLKAQAQNDKTQKIEALKQTLAINEEILAKYSDTSSRPGVERSIRSIKSEIEFLIKGK